MHTFIKIKDLYVNTEEIASFKFKREVICPASGPGVERFTIRLFLKNGRDMESKAMTLEEKLKVEVSVGQTLNILPWLGKMPIVYNKSKLPPMDLSPAKTGLPDY